MVDKVARSFEVELPYRENLDEYIDVVLREIKQWSEDLNERKFYVAPGGKPWMEIRDDENFHESVLHFFNDNGEYLQSVNGNVSRGKWRLMDGTNKLILESGNRSELYVLAFLSQTFFILRKHGNHRSGGKGRGKYFVMGYEPFVAGLEWRDYVELLFNTYRDNQTSFRTILIILIIAAAAIIFFSLL